MQQSSLGTGSTCRVLLAFIRTNHWLPMSPDNPSRCCPAVGRSAPMESVLLPCESQSCRQMGSGTHLVAQAGLL